MGCRMALNALSNASCSHLNCDTFSLIVQQRAVSPFHLLLIVIHESIRLACSLPVHIRMRCLLQFFLLITWHYKLHSIAASLFLAIITILLYISKLLGMLFLSDIHSELSRDFNGSKATAESELDDKSWWRWWWWRKAGTYAGYECRKKKKEKICCSPSCEIHYGVL